MQNHIFREYDIRGIVGTELFIEDVYNLAHAIAYYCSGKNRSVKTVVVGMDGRIHSEPLKDQLIRGLRDAGLNVVFIGQCTTPLLYFSQYQFEVDLAVMVTASHNPQEYNGFKIVFQKEPIAGQELQQIKEYLYQKKKRVIKKGTLEIRSLLNEYCQLLKKQFSHLQGSELPVVFDCSNAVAALVIPELIALLEFKNVYIIHQTIDGTFPHHEPDPTNEATLHDLKKAVAVYEAAVGIGFDGDADRMGVVTAAGNHIAGDKLLALFSKEVLKKHPGTTVVCDSKCSDGLHELIKKWGGNLYTSKTGHTFIKKALQKTGSLVAGELSCHFFFKDRYFGFDDGIYAALRLIEILHNSKISLEEHLAEFPYRFTSPELRIVCPLQQGPEIVNVAYNYFKTKQNIEIATLDGIRIHTDFGWGLLRSSNTQSVVCLRLEAQSKEALKKLKILFIEALLPCYSLEFLEKTITW